MGLRPLVVAALVVLGVPLSAHAQASASAGSSDPRWDLFAGYSYLRSGDGNLHGGMGALGWKLRGPISLVGEVATHQGNDGSEDVTTTSYLGGARYGFGSGSLRGFVQALAGAARTSRGISVFGVDITETSTGFGGAAGAGFDYGLGERWAIRVQADYRLAKEETETSSDPRASVGVVLRFGSQ